MSVPKTNQEGQAKTAHGADLLAARDRDRNAASRLPHGRDASRANVERAKREQWSTTQGARFPRE